MSTTPNVFISATSGDLRSIRQIVKEALLTINCHPVEQTNFEPDWRTVEGMLRGKIEGCQALIHIVGLRYGAEPRPDSLPPGTPRRSYTQMEYDLGIQIHEQRGDAGFRVYTFVCPDTFPFDIPTDADGHPMPPEAEEKAALQRQHRAAILAHPRLRETPGTPDELRIRILALQEQVLALQQEQTGVKTEVRRSHRLLWLVLLLLLGLGGGLWWMKRGQHQDIQTVVATQKDILEAQQVTTARIRVHLLEASELRRKQDHQAADLAPKADIERLHTAADSAHQSRLSRIDDLARSFAILEGQSDATEQMQKMSRLLANEGVDAALKYAEEQKPAILAAVAASIAADQAKHRAQLQPLLQAAGLQETKGQTAAARASYQDLLKLDPQWPEALEGYATFLFDQSIQSEAHGTLAAALADAEACLAHAQRFHGLDPAQPRAQRVLSAAHDQMGDVLTLRGAEGDADRIIRHCQQSLALAEALYQADPTAPEAARDVSLSLDRLGDFLSQRGQPGDADTALRHSTRSLELREKLLAASPDSAQAARDVAISHERLGDFARDHNKPEDAEGHYRHSLETWEKMHLANPDSAYYARGGMLPASRLAKLAETTGKGDAQAWWRRAHGILAGMKQKGMFLSPQDEKVLEALRGKVK